MRFTEVDGWGVGGRCLWEESLKETYDSEDSETRESDRLESKPD
jgi:hypothetical protein